MLPKVYLETTIPSYLVARPSRNLQLASAQEATKLWWNDHRHRFHLFVSHVVLREVSRGDAQFAAERINVLKNAAMLSIVPEAEDLARRLIANSIIPANAENDATHVAYAAAHEMDFLLTWNCTHIHNASIFRRIEKACAEFGFRCPVICTPDELMNFKP
jgi:hypothetical protein